MFCCFRRSFWRWCVQVCSFLCVVQKVVFSLTQEVNFCWILCFNLFHRGWTKLENFLKMYYSYFLLAGPVELSVKERNHFNLLEEWQEREMYRFIYLSITLHLLSTVDSWLQTLFVFGPRRQWLQCRRPGELREAQDDCQGDQTCGENDLSQHGPCPHVQTEVSYNST